MVPVLQLSSCWVSWFQHFFVHSHLSKKCSWLSHTVSETCDIGDHKTYALWAWTPALCVHQHNKHMCLGNPQSLSLWDTELIASFSTSPENEKKLCKCCHLSPSTEIATFIPPSTHKKCFHTRVHSKSCFGQLVQGGQEWCSAQMKTLGSVWCNPDWSKCPWHCPFNCHTS